METLLLIVVIGLQTADQRWDFHTRIGLVRIEGDMACLAINADGLKRGDDPIFVVGLEARPGRTFTAEVQSSVERCPGLPDFDFAYRLSFIGDAPRAAVLGAATGVFRIIGYPGGRIAFKLSPAPSPHVLRFASCSDQGGVRVALLSDHPTQDTEVWSTVVPDLVIDVPLCPK